MFDGLIYAVLLGSLLFFIPSRMDGDEQFAYFALMLVAVLPFFIPQKRLATFKSVGFLALTVIISVIFNFSIPERCGLINFFVGIMALKAMVEYSDMKIRDLGVVLIYFAVLQNVLIIFQALGKEHFYMGVYPEIAGCLMVPWIMGCVAAISVPFVMSVHPILCLMLLPQIFLSHSNVCVGASFAGFLIPLWIDKKINTAQVVAALVLVSGIFLKYRHGINLDRVKLWLFSFRYIKNFFIGNGLGSFAHEAFSVTNGDASVLTNHYYWRWAHSEPYQFFFETGFMGLLPLFYFIHQTLNRNKYLLSAFVSIFVLSLAHPIFHFGKTLPLLLTVLAMGYRYGLSSE